MKRIFIDTNILIDFIDNREGADNAETIIPFFSSTAFVNQLDDLLYK